MTNPSVRPISRSAFLAAGAAGLVLAACGGAAKSAGGATTTTSVTPLAEPGGPAPLVGAITIYGEPFDANTLVGRPTVAWFWAPWCVICRGEGPDVAEIAARYAGQVHFLGIAGLGASDEMREFVSATGTNAITHLDDGSGAIWSSYEIYSQPAYAFITADGRLETFVGSLGFDGLVSVIDQLLVA